MYKQGHTVYGVDCAEMAVKGFFEDNSLPYDTENVENIGKLYKVCPRYLRQSTDVLKPHQNIC